MKCKLCGFPKVESVMFQGDTCQACLNFMKRKEINWQAREKELEGILEKHRGKKPYDCALAISGGKDSHWLLNKLEELGMHPLLLTVMDRFTHTKAGAHNFNNLLRRHNNIMYTINMDVFVKSTRWGFEQLGQPLKYTEYCLYTMPYEICKSLGIPLLIYGENASYEYGSTDIEQYVANGQVYRLVQNMRGERDWWKEGGVDIKEIEAEIEGIPLIVYMSYFYPWSSVGHLEVAQRMGFKDLEWEWDREGCCENFEQIDSYGYIAHLWFRYPRLGYQRTTDIATRRVREGIWTKEYAEEIIKERDSILDRDACWDFTNILGYERGEVKRITEGASWNKYHNKETKNGN